MFKPFDEIVIERRNWTVGEIVNDFGSDGTIIFDNSYEIPAMCAHMDDELISILLRNNNLTLYSVLDSNGYLHVNIDDFNRLKKYLGDKDINDSLNYRRRYNANIDWRCIDYRVHEDLKKDFWMKVGGIFNKANSGIYE